MPGGDHGDVAVHRLYVAVPSATEIATGAWPQPEVLLGMPVDLVVPRAVPRPRVVRHLIVLVARLCRSLGETSVLGGDRLLRGDAGHAGGVPEAALVEGQRIGRKMVRIPAEHVLHGRIPCGQIEAGQAVDQIDANVGKPGGAGHLESCARLGRRVEAIESGQNAIVEALNTQAVAAHALGIALDGDLRACGDAKARAEPLEDPSHGLDGEERGRAPTQEYAAEIDDACPRGGSDQVHLSEEGGQEALHGARRIGRRVEGAVAAASGAEGDVQVRAEGPVARSPRAEVATDTNRAAGHGSLPTQARAVGHGSARVFRHDVAARSRTSRCSASSTGFARASESWGEASEGGATPLRV